MFVHLMTDQVLGHLTMVQDRSSYVQSDIQNTLDTLKPPRRNCKISPRIGPSWSTQLVHGLILLAVRAALVPS